MEAYIVRKKNFNKLLNCLNNALLEDDSLKLKKAVKRTLRIMTAMRDAAFRSIGFKTIRLTNEQSMKEEYLKWLVNYINKL